MRLFGNSSEKHGFSRSANAEAAPQIPLAPQTTPAPRAAAASVPQPSHAAQASLAPIASVDVMKRLERLAASNGQNLDWKVSIADLLKLLGLDSSYAGRKELAAELGCPPEMMASAARMNIWLHKAVLQKLVLLD